MVDIPRVSVPDAVEDVLAEQGLKNPNDLAQADYNTYSGAAIGGTLLFFLLPGAFLFDITGILSEFLFKIIGDFIVSAAIGGGLCIYLSLRKDELGEYANKFGAVFLQGVDKLVSLLPFDKKD